MSPIPLTKNAPNWYGTPRLFFERRNAVDDALAAFSNPQTHTSTYNGAR